MSLQDRIRAGKFVLLGEFEPPKGDDFSGLLKNALLTKGRLDAVVVPLLTRVPKAPGLPPDHVST